MQIHRIQTSYALGHFFNLDIQYIKKWSIFFCRTLVKSFISYKTSVQFIFVMLALSKHLTTVIFVLTTQTKNCKIEPQNIHTTTKDFLVSGEEFSLIKNETFGFLETHPQPSEENLSRYYESDKYISHTDSKKGLMPFLYQWIKKRSLNKKVKLIGKLNNGTGTILDIGAGTGDFLKVARDSGWNIFGMEPSLKARGFAASKNIHLEESLKMLEGKKYDVISLWHVLEHLPDLHKQIKKIEQLVKDDGFLVIAVPNFNSYDAKYYKNFWAAYDVPRHLWHFSKSSIRKIIPLNFELKKILPMVFDSFYVCLLSEKYKKGSSFSIKAIFIGFLSNLKALTSKEHSSLIYIFKKTK